MNLTLWKTGNIPEVFWRTWTTSNEKGRSFQHASQSWRAFDIMYQSNRSFNIPPPGNLPFTSDLPYIVSNLFTYVKPVKVYVRTHAKITPQWKSTLSFFYAYAYACVAGEDRAQGHSPVLHCASLLRIILRVISARALENGGFFFTAGPRQIGKSSFSRKRLQWPIIFVVVLNWVVNFSM